MPFKKGNNKGKGRGKGNQNKHTKKFKDLLTETYLALENAKDDNLGLLAFAKKNPADFYRICNKLIPQSIDAELTGEVTITVKRD